MKAISLSIIVILISCATYAAELHVPQDYSTIQEAINNANTGDVVVVANGTYFENINFSGKAITVTSNFHFSNDQSDIAKTIINGSQNTNANNGSCVTFNMNETAQSILKGFTITGGKGTRTFNSAENLYFRTGGGILIDRASPTITNNIIENNVCVAEAGVFGAGGGGIRMGFGLPTITNNIIRNNTGGYAGGIMIAYCNGAVIKNNIIVDNTATGSFDGGGGVYVDWEPVTLENNTIANNHSGGKGGGIISTGTSTIIVNCIIYGNTADISSPQIYKRFGGNATLTYTCIEGGFNGSGNQTGVITNNPLFDGTHNYYLTPTSPCIDAGNPASNFEDNEDGKAPGNALYPALGSTTNDMGAYGGQASALLSSIGETTQFEDVTFTFANPYDNKGVTVQSTESLALEARVFSLDGKQLKHSFTAHVDTGNHHLPLVITTSCLVIFNDDSGHKQTILLIK